ncbi:DNase I-like protein, partial [Trametes sanguinea]
MRDTEVRRDNRQSSAGHCDNRAQNGTERARSNEAAPDQASPEGRRRKAERLLRKTAVRLGSLNMNGFGNLLPEHPDNKWRTMYKMIQQNRIGILLLQETHLTLQRKQDIMSMFKGRIKMFFSAHPEAPTRKEGIAVVLNKNQINANGATAVEIIPGRALQVSVQVHAGDVLNILCMYAPTSDGVEARRVFFQKVREHYEQNTALPRPHLMAGDFNNVEDRLDRIPATEPDSSLQELDALKAALGLMIADGWRVTNPTEKAYTFHRGSGGEATCSRLDRIYVTEALFPRCREWEIRVPAVKTDHSLITVQITTENAPTTGKGRPIFPLNLLKNKVLARNMKSAGIEALSQIESFESGDARTHTRNAQTVLYDLKSKWMEMARTMEREYMPKQLAELQMLKEEKSRVQKDQFMPDVERAAMLAKLNEQIMGRELKRSHAQQRNGRAKHRIDGERPTKYWTKLHKECAPRDTIQAFEKVGTVNDEPSENREYVNDTVIMAEMARTYHDDIQRDERGVPQGDERERCIGEALLSLDAHLDDEQASGMAAPITYEECALALRFSKNGTAPGKDGLPYEVWKTLQQRFVEDSRHEDRSAFDIVKLLHLVMTDIQRHGVCEAVPFAEGWMAPIYKEKGERTQIANYRPITLLNTDYKLLSKVLSIRL